MSFKLLLYDSAIDQSAPVDLMPDMREVQATRGAPTAKDWLLGVGFASTLQATIRHSMVSKYDVFNTTSSLYGKLRPGRRVSLVEDVSGTITEYWTGHLTSPTWGEARRTGKQGHLNAVGALTWYNGDSHLIGLDPSTPGLSGSGDKYGNDFINAALNAVINPYNASGTGAVPRTLDTGSVAMAVGFTLSTGLFGSPDKPTGSIAGALAAVTQTEQGRLYELGNGRIRWRNAAGVTTDDAVAVISANPSPLKVAAISPYVSLYNDICARVSGGEYIESVKLKTFAEAVASDTYDLGAESLFKNPPANGFLHNTVPPANGVQLTLSSLTGSQTASVAVPTGDWVSFYQWYGGALYSGELQ